MFLDLEPAVAYAGYTSNYAVRFTTSEAHV